MSDAKEPFGLFGREAFTFDSPHYTWHVHDSQETQKKVDLYVGAVDLYILLEGKGSPSTVEEVRGPAYEAVRSEFRASFGAPIFTDRLQLVGRYLDACSKFLKVDVNTVRPSTIGDFRMLLNEVRATIDTLLADCEEGFAVSDTNPGLPNSPEY